jgi:hypothetical protein
MMSSTQVEDRAGSATMFALPEAAQVAGWQVQAIEEYEHSLPAERAGLREELAARILLLTGQRVAPDNAYADANGRMAVAGIDGATFRLYRGGGLVVAQSCAYCGTGHFESPRISSVADLGYALGTWRPLHEDCEDYDTSEDLADW